MAEKERFTKAVSGAAPSMGRLQAWPTLTAAAEMLGISLSALSRTMDADGITKHAAGRRGKRIAPVNVLDLAVVYAVDANEAAEQLMEFAESSGAEQQFIDGAEEDIGAWFAGAARNARSPEVSVEQLVDAVREIVAPNVADAILARAGLRGGSAGASRLSQPAHASRRGRRKGA